MKTSLRKLGNSTGAIIPSAVLNKAGFLMGEELDIEAVEGQIVIKQAKPIYTLQQLLTGVDESMVELDQQDRAWLQSTLGSESIEG